MVTTWPTASQSASTVRSAFAQAVCRTHMRPTIDVQDFRTGAIYVNDDGADQGNVRACVEAVRACASVNAVQ